MPCYANGTFRIDAAAMVKFTAYTSSYTLPYMAQRGGRRGGAAQSCQFPEGEKYLHSTTLPSFDASSPWTRGISRESCGSCAVKLPIRWNLPVGHAIRIGSGTRRSAPRRRAARSRHPLPTRRGSATAARHDVKGSRLQALGTDATAAAHKQGAAWPSSSRIRCGPSSRRRSIG